MAKKYLDENGLLYFWQKIKTMFALVAHTHTKSQITDFPTSMTPSSHTHGNITNEGALQSTDVDIANGDKLVVTDSSNSNKVARTGTSFDGSTTTKALTQKGTFETFLQEHQDISGKVPITRTVNGHALSSDVTVTKSDVGLGNVDNTADSNKEVDKANTLKTARTIDGVKFDGSAGIIHYGVCSSSAALAAKTVDCTGFTLVTGAWIAVKFTHENTASWSGVTLNVNNTGAKNIKYRGGAGVTELPHLQLDNTILMLVYDGTNYEVVGTMTYYPWATTSVPGLMSPTDKGKVDKLLFDSNNLIDSSILPSYVDDVIEAYPLSGATELSSSWLSTSSGGSALTPETGKIYVLMAASTSYEANTQFRWSGTTYVKLSDGGVSEITNSEIDTIVAS